MFNILLTVAAFLVSFGVLFFNEVRWIIEYFNRLPNISIFLGPHDPATPVPRGGHSGHSLSKMVSAIRTPVHRPGRTHRRTYNNRRTALGARL